jgi:4-hydroxy-tetrahydrodipicolinate synthase
LIAHFKAIAQCTDKPILLYNVPGRTVVDLLPQSVAELAKVDNIVGIKEASGLVERVSEIKQLCGSEFSCLSGDDPSSLEFLTLGGDGVISVTANVAPRLISDMCRCVAAGDVREAKLLNDKLSLLHQRLFIEPNPVPAKWVLQQMGLISSDKVRLPLVCLEPNSQISVKEAMQIAGLVAGN